MTAVCLCAPAGELREMVRCYALNRERCHPRQEDCGDGAEARKPMVARAELFMCFFLSGRIVLVDEGSGVTQAVPAVSVVGPQTQRHGQFVVAQPACTFVIFFQPAGFHRLFRLPMPEIADQSIDAEALIGPALRQLHGQLQEAGELPAMAQLADAFLTARLHDRGPPHPVQAVARALLECHGALGVDAMAASCRLSCRQFERAFQSQVGVPPKLYARIARFRHMMALRHDHPRRSWAEIALDAGYCDQMHLVHDCRALAGDTPSALARTAGLRSIRGLDDEGLRPIV